MLGIDRYQINECIQDGGWYRLYRGECLQNRREVVVKYLADSHPSPAMLANFRSEHQILQQLAMPAVIQALGLEDHGRRLLLVREYFPGKTLRDYAAGRMLSSQEACRLVMLLAEIIAAIHERGIVHGNLNPDNILIERESYQLKLIGFSHAMANSQCGNDAEHDAVSARDIDYLAPEQSGRMNRGIDGRADIYALGLTFFELLTGRAPFTSSDSIGLIHRHIAQSIPDPREFCPHVPEIVVGIISKMLAKDPSERYATATELLSDIKICYQILMTGEPVDRPSLTESGHALLKMSRRIYGREAELAQLAGAFERSRRNNAVLCRVSGRSGVGKSRLFDAFSREILSVDCYFITAKCDQYKVNPPAQIFHAAFTGLLQQLLGEDASTLAMWQQRLHDQLGAEAQPIIELIPELEILLGPQPALPKLPTAETKTRLLRLWVRFVQAFCRPDRPLCVFLDDIQWADPALFEWLQQMLLDVKHLLLIIAYRDDEIVDLPQMMSKLCVDSGQVETVELAPLPVSALVEMINDSMVLEEGSAIELCGAIVDKTHGNPFFFIQYLRELQQDGILRFHAATGKWRYDNDKIRAVAISDNVIDFMLLRITALAQPVRELLKLAACIGTSFNAELIAAAFGEHLSAQKNLAIAEKLGLLIKRSGNGATERIDYIFAHDRVQQAAHSLLAEHELLANRLQIGRYWVNIARDNQDKQTLVQAVEHLNAALVLMVDAEERRSLGADNFKLGLWSKHSGAFEQALPYLRQASELLEESLHQAGGLAAIYRHRAECEHLCGYHQEAKQFFEQAVTLAKSDLEKARIFELMIQFYADLAQFEQAYQVSRQASALFGIDLPARFNRLAFVADFLYLKYRLRRFNVDDLLKLPAVTDVRMEIAIRLLSATLKVAYQLQPELCAAISVKQVSRCLQYGNNAEAVIGYMVFGVIFLGGVLGNHQAGYDYGRLSLGLLDRFANQRQRAEVNFVYGYFAHSWTHPAADTENYWRAALESGLESSDWFHSGCACCGLAQSQLMRGVPLDKLWHDTDGMLTTLKRIDSQEHLGVLLGVRQAIQTLRGNIDTDFDEAAFVESLSGYGTRHFAHYYFVNKMHCLYLWGEYDSALKLSRLSAGYLKDSAGMLHGVEHHFYYALILAKLYPGLARLDRYKALGKIQRTEKKLRHWARRCPQNFQSRYHLLAGEIQRLRHHPELALLAYQHAANDAEANGQLHLEALANELAARLHADLGQERLAKFHFEEAVYCYRRWGATGYLQQFKIVPKRGGAIRLSNHTVSTRQGTKLALDTVTLIKAAETIAAERRLPQLLQTLMHIVIENAGAQRGVLLLQEHGGLLIQAEAQIDVEQVAVMQGLLLSAAGDLPQSVINYVSRSKESVVLENAGHSAVYGRDKDIVERQVRSVLCAPLLLGGELQGVLYLENNAADAVFTGERVFLLQHLSGQIAISIDNALGYQLLEDKVTERTKHIETQKVVLEEKNSELEAHNTTIQALNERLQSENWERRVAERNLQIANEELERLVMVDGLTNIGNRRHFDEYLEIECQRLARDGTALAMILCDIDYFKKYNDHYGHQAGDDCLIKVAQAITSALRRPTDLAARYGGEEFAVIMPHTDENGALQVADLIRQAVLDLQISHQGSQVAEFVTLSIGIATAVAMPHHHCSPALLIKTADDALYQVKENGRNGIIQKIVV
ncbi:MAG: diguanylate cyclase [Methylobacter sp.]|nr:diguanylate cyclase [Methylobacter sp.]